MTVQQLIAIGFWNDGSDDCPLHNPQEFVDPRGDEGLREDLFHYLNAGSPTIQYLGYSWCRFACGIDESEMGTSDLSDGVWLWPEGLAHYVARHGVRLPDEFVEHARSNGFRAPVAQLEDEATVDATFWAEWCASNSNGDPEAKAVWRRTAVEIEAAESDILQKLIEKHGGLSEDTCAWAGCESSALLGLAFCPSCAHNQMNHWP
ncbi:MAG: hypothetical protein JRH01_02230 [Deltaproteobacteria bacterium]|nr:hypothetical protein [Deltaproteobacteria bacterium]MBW2394070.1 hypothetical protein [Deltaproteobacteria bacterium]